jgi:two-component system NtrC family sensor kinase
MSKPVGHVLVVDDDPAIHALYERTLTHEGFTVCAANDGQEALAQLAHASFDLILLDLHMPHIDGLTLLGQIRERDTGVSILIVTGDASLEQAAQAMRLGAQGLLLKPFSSGTLRDTAIDLLKKRRAVKIYDRVNALRPVVRISERLLTELDLSRLQDQIIDTVRTEMGADRASLMLLVENGEKLQIVACSGLPPGVRVGHTVPVKSSLAGWVAQTRSALSIDGEGEISPDVDLDHLLVEDQAMSALSVPVLAGDRVLGVLNAAKVRIAPPFTAADKELLLLLAGQAAIAIENARLYTNVSNSEARYRALLQHANDAVLLLDPRGRRILDVNLALEHLSGYRREELLTLSPRKVLPETEKWQVNGTHVNGNGEHAEIETVLQTRWDHTTPVAISVSAVPYNGQQLLLLIARDISERQRIARQLIQTEKLAALGRLAASMAHEINNPLQAIHNSLHLLLTRPMPDEKRERYLAMTSDEVNRLILIVQRILDFYRPSREGMRPLHLHDMLETVLTFTANQLEQQRVTVVREFHPNLPTVAAISNHLKQVFFSLIFNAVEAMPEGGELHIRTYVREPGADESAEFTFFGGSSNERVEDPAVVIEFHDTGEGIPQQELPKIFEPFFTTRTKGTGLGLAVSYAIIEQHHGEFAVHSEVGKGTIFRIILPSAP